MNSINWVREFIDDLNRFPEYFNALSYVMMAMVTMYLLWITSNARCQAFLRRHFMLSPDNLMHGRLHTLFTYQLLETSIITLVINLGLMRLCGNALMNKFPGVAGEWMFLRVYAVLSVVPALVYCAIIGSAMDITSGASSEWMTVGSLELPKSAFVPSQQVSGAHAVTAGLLANFLMEHHRQRIRVPIAGLKPMIAIPFLCGVYFATASTGSNDSWLALIGTGLTVAVRGSAVPIGTGA